MSDFASPLLRQEDMPESSKTRTRRTANHALTQEDLEAVHPTVFHENTLKSMAKAAVEKRPKVNRQCTMGLIHRFIPSTRWIPKYKLKEYLMNDILAGITIGIMNIPQGMAYGMLAGLQPVNGVFAIIALLNSNGINTIAEGMGVLDSPSGSMMNVTANDSMEPSYCGAGQSVSQLSYAQSLEYSMTLTFLVGLIQIGLSLLRLGFLSVLLSDQLVQGLTSGAAMYVFTVQIKHLFGIASLKRPSGIFGLPLFYVEVFKHIEETNVATLITSLLCISFLVAVKELVNPRVQPKIKMPIPGELIVVVFSTLIMFLSGLPEKYNILVVCKIPQGLAAPSMPNVTNMSLVMHALEPAFIIAIVMFSIECSLAKLFAKKHDYEIDASQEFFALGISHIVTSFFQGHNGGSSLSRCMIQSNQGAKSQIPSLVSSTILLLVLYVAYGWFYFLPKCILSSIIVVCLKGMYVQIGNLPPLWKKNKVDFFIWLVTFASVVLLDITYGLIAGIAFSVLTIVYRTIVPSSYTLNRPSGMSVFKEESIYEDLKATEGVFVFRYDAPLYYANAELFKEALYKKSGVDPFRIRKGVRKLAKQEKRRMLKEQKNGSPFKELTPASLEANVDDKVKAQENGPTAEDKNAAVSNSENNSSSNPFGTKLIIVDCSPFSFLDLMGMEVLKRIREDLKSVNVRLVLANVSAQHLQLFHNNDFYEKFPKNCLFLTVASAVKDFKADQTAASMNSSGSSSGGSNEEVGEDRKKDRTSSSPVPSESALNGTADGNDDTMVIDLSPAANPPTPAQIDNQKWTTNNVNQPQV